MEDELRAKEEVREQLSSAEKRGIQLAGELEELRTQLEMADRARKSAESEMNDAADRVSELLAANASLTSARRKLEADMNAMQVKERKEKGKETDLYSAYRQYNSTTKRSDVDHTGLPANTPHLPFLRINIR